MGNYKDLSKMEIEAKLSKMSLQERRRLFRYALETVRWEAPVMKPRRRPSDKKAS